MSYMTLVNERLPKEIQEIILQKACKDLVLVRGFWMDFIHEDIEEDVDDRRPFNCNPNMFGEEDFENLPCSEKVCKCHCRWSKKTYRAWIEQIEALEAMLGF